ncbi:MAG: tetratricopeptide repeat protein [Planctomycetota bacterium]|nr:tetratricopeptide repeat protein [Planctomycetota bacterium]
MDETTSMRTAVVVTAIVGFLAGSGCRQEQPVPTPEVKRSSGEQPNGLDQTPFAPATYDGVEVIPARPKIGSYLFGGCGDAHLEISRVFEEAQKLFDQGLAQLHGHWYYEAERSFRQILATEPDCAMAHWGVAMANVHNPDRASEAMAEAIYHRQRTNARERLWIDGLAAFYEITPAMAKTNHARIWFDPKPGQPPLPAPKRKFAKSLEERTRALVAQYDRLVEDQPGDIEAIAFRVNQHWLNRLNDFAALPKADLDAQLDQVFAQSPYHPAHLYRMLLWEAEDPSRAKASAKRVTEIAPANGNMWYWAGRIFTALNQPRQAIPYLEQGLRADHVHMQRFYMMPYEVFHYGRSLETTVRTLVEDGRGQDALDLARHAFAMPRHPRFNRLRERYSLAGRTRAAASHACRKLGLDHELKLLESEGHLGIRKRRVGEPTSTAARLAKESFWEPQVRRNWVLRTADNALVDFRRDYQGKTTLLVLYQGFG